MPDVKQKISRAFQELAVIVLGVLIALGAQAGYEARVDHQRETIYLAELHRDLQLSIEGADATLERSDSLIQELQGFLEEVRASEPLADSLSAPIPSATSIPVVMGTLTALVSQGDLDLVRSPQLRREMIIVSSSVSGALEINREFLSVGAALSQEWLEMREIIRVEDALPDLRIPARSVRARPRMVGLYARHLNLLQNMHTQYSIIRDELGTLSNEIEAGIGRMIS